MNKQMTRDEHIDAARELARLNPEWEWNDAFEDLTHESGAAIYFCVTHWRARRDGFRVGGDFPTPYAAARALGFNVKESEG